MSKRVLEVGSCAMDHASIRAMIQQHFDAQVVRAHGWPDALAEMQNGTVDLVLVNRKLDRDQSDGLEIIRRVKADSQLSSTPCMLVSNYPEYQAQAVREGAESGFGKAELHTPQTVEKLRRFLDSGQS